MVSLVRKRITLIALAALPLVIAISTLLWSTEKMLQGIATSVNELDEQRIWQSVRSAMNLEGQHLSGVLSAKAKSDIAVENTYEKFNPDWIKNNWGLATIDDNYDTVFVVDSSGNTLLGFHKGHATKVSATEYFGEVAQRVRGELPLEAVVYRSVATLAQTKNGLSMMAMAPIMPFSKTKALPSRKPIYLLLSRVVDEAMLKQFARQYGIKNLVLTLHADGAGAGHDLKDRWSRKIAQVSWEDNLLGAAARDSYFWISIASIAAMIAAMTPLAIYMGRVVTKMDDDEKKSYQLARTDLLSNLPNRRFFNETLEAKAENFGNGEYALMLIDLDGFKAVNDTFDHATGDALIQAVSAGLRSLVGEEHTLARLGGDEFAILVEGQSAQALAFAISRSILEFVKEPFDINGCIASIGASIGVAVATSDGIEAGELMRRADVAMYTAKGDGRGRYQVYDSRLDNKRSEDREIAQEMRQMLANEDFNVAYQPIVDANSQDIVGVEALARWPAKSPRQLRPDRFIAVAEEFGLIDSLSLVILKKAFHDVAMWPGQTLSVNISPLQFNNPRFIDDLQSLAALNGFDLRRLTVEFTEAVLISNPSRARNIIHQIHNLGISIALDDFGKGFASVGYLREFKFDTIKLDRSLTQQHGEGAEVLQIIHGTILLAKGLSAKVVAEGIESIEEAQLMRLAGCNMLQGYYFGKPQTAAEFTALLKSTPRNALAMHA